MKKIIPLIILLSLFMLGCSAEKTSSIGSSCESLQPTEGDIQYALQYGNQLFQETNWIRSYTVQELDAIVSWTHRSLPAIADVSLLLFCNDRGTDDIDLFYNDETVRNNFLNYDSADIISSCKKDNTRLYQLDAMEENINYTIHFWAQPLNKTRLISVVVVFPKNESTLIESYDKELFPELPACP